MEYQKDLFSSMSSISYLECSRCHARLSAETPQTVCTACADQPAGLLFVHYDFSHLKGTRPEDVVGKAAHLPWTGMWRYRAVLPDVAPVTAG
jgi:threonine synthase